MLWRAVPKRGMILSRAGRVYREEALEAIEEQIGKRDPMTGRLVVVLEVFPPDRRKRDLSNIPKAVEDAITKAETVWVDDEQIDDLRIIRREVMKPALVRVHIRELESEINPQQQTVGW